MTLTATEKGHPKPTEFIGVPNITRKEMGKAKVAQKEKEKDEAAWNRSKYLAKRRLDLTGTIAGVDSYRPVG